MDSKTNSNSARTILKLVSVNQMMSDHTNIFEYCILSFIPLKQSVEEQRPADKAWSSCVAVSALLLLRNSRLVVSNLDGRNEVKSWGYRQS